MAWDAGSKGVMALNLVDPATSAIACIVDLNPRKHGRFIAGTGHPIMAPDRLGEVTGASGRDLVLVLNGLYAEQIRGTLGGLGLSPELFVV